MVAIAVSALILTGSAQIDGTRWTPDDVHQAAAEARHPREVLCIFTAEVGGYGFNPYVPHGDAGVVGAGRFGELRAQAPVSRMGV